MRQRLGELLAQQLPRHGKLPELLESYAERFPVFLYDAFFHRLMPDVMEKFFFIWILSEKWLKIRNFVTILLLKSAKVWMIDVFLLNRAVWRNSG